MVRSNSTYDILDKHEIAWVMHFSQPTQQYLDFIASYVRVDYQLPVLIDPFTCDGYSTSETPYYIPRKKIEENVKLASCCYIIGCDGSGKTFLCKCLPALLAKENLVVTLPFDSSSSGISLDDFEEGKASPLSVKPLISGIFNAFWQNIFLNTDQRKYHYRRMRENTRWLCKLRWFYQNFIPFSSEIPDEFELMAWLRTPTQDRIFPDNMTPEQTLRELVNLTTFLPKTDSVGKKLFMDSPYQQIVLLVDVFKEASFKASIRLMQDAQRLQNYNLPRLSWKIFCDSSLETLIQEQACIRQGRAAIILMPPWNEDDLVRLLAERIHVLIGHNEGEEPERWVRQWGTSLPLENKAKAKFVDLLVNGALRVYLKNENDAIPLGAPVHALRLARGLLSACSGCWQSYGYIPPLSLTQLQELISIYWDYEEKNYG